MAGTIGYHAVQRRRRTHPTSIIIPWMLVGQPLRAVIWDSPRQAWTYDPTTAETLMFDDHFQEEVRPISRTEAEQIAREHLGTELPSEEEIRRICEEGAKQGRNSGQPA